MTLLHIFGIDLTKYPILGHLWYVRCLIFLALLSPVINFFTSKYRYCWLLFCFVLTILHKHIPNPKLNFFFLHVFSLDGLFYFSIGIFIQQCKSIKVTRLSAIVSAVIGLLLLSTKIVFFYNVWKYQVVLGKLSIPFLIYAIWYFIPDNRWPLWFTSCSFPIFLMHTFFFPYIDIVIRNFHISISTPVLQPILNFVFGFFGSIVVANILRHFFPKLSFVLFGGR